MLTTGDEHRDANGNYGRDEASGKRESTARTAEPFLRVNELARQSFLVCGETPALAFECVDARDCGLMVIPVTHRDSQDTPDARGLR